MPKKFEKLTDFKSGSVRLASPPPACSGWAYANVGSSRPSERRRGLVLPLQEGFSAFLDGAGDLLNIRRPLV